MKLYKTSIDIGLIAEEGALDFSLFSADIT
jgi:hypothetical protein